MYDVEFQEAGEYAVCFSNEFSTFTHKTVYLSFESGDENPVFKGIQEHDTVMTFMEATADEIHSSLDDTINGQTHYRLVGFILRSIFLKISVPILFIAFLI